MPHIKHALSHHLFSVTRGLLYILVFLTPIFFLPFTTDILELNKQTLLLLLTFTAALTWVGGMLLEKRFAWRRGWVNILPLLFLAAVGLSAWFSSAPFLSWVGGGMQEYTSVLTILGLTVLFFLVTTVFSDKKAHRFIYLLLLVSAILAGVVALMSLFGIHLPFSFSKTQAFNTIGTINSVGLYLVTISALGSALWISHRPSDMLLYEKTWGLVERLLIVLLEILTFCFLLTVDYSLLWMLFVVSHVLLFVFVFFRSQDFSSAKKFVLPAFLVVLALPFWFWIPSIFHVTIPTEITPNLKASTNVASQTLEKFSSLYGSGPGTYLFDFASFHDAQVNQTDFFNTRFDRAGSFYLTLLPTVGYLGMITLFVFLFATGIKALRHILRSQAREDWLRTFVAFVPWITLVLAGAFFPFNFTLITSLFLFSAFLGCEILPTSATSTRTHLTAVRFFFSFILMVGALAFLVGIFFTVERYMGEAAFASAVRADRKGTSLESIVASLDRAATLNRYDDRSYRILAQALIARVKEQLKTASTAADLTEESRQYIQALVASSVNAAVRATDLSPRNVTNWLTRATVYRDLLNLVPNASTFAINAIQKAIELEPLNPTNWNELGITYLAIGEQKRALTVSDDKKVADAAQKELTEALTQAEHAFDKAIELKSNYAPAHYQLGLTYERQGRVDDAIGKIESVARYNTSDVGVAFQLGQLYLRRAKDDDIARAKDALEHAVLLAPSYSDARWFLASVYEKEGNLKAAIEQIKKVLELNPGSAVVKSRLDRLVKGQTSVEVPPAL
ncbi:MAG: tetratricopeptide repeat protein [Patescibacteria group bacterium]